MILALKTQQIMLTINEKRSWNCFQAPRTINNKWVALTSLLLKCESLHFHYFVKSLLAVAWICTLLFYCVCGSRFQHSYKIVMLFKILRLCKITARTVLVCLNVPFIFQIFLSLTNSFLQLLETELSIFFVLFRCEDQCSLC